MRMIETRADRLFNIFSVTIITLNSIIMLYPFYYLLIFSLNDPMDAMLGGIYLWPRKFSLISYTNVFATDNLPHAAMVTILRTVTGTAVSVFSCSVLAYVLSRPHLLFRKFFSRFFVVTMYFNAGLIPYYMVVRQLKLNTSFLVYIIPGIINVFYVVLIKTYMEQMPASLAESAEIDGANDLVVFFKIILPLCKPVITVVIIFTAVGHWNAWFDNFIFTSRKKELTTLQLILVNKLKQVVVTRSADLMKPNEVSTFTVTPESIRAAITMIVTIPIICVYPFFQKYFTQGIMIGSIKG